MLLVHPLNQYALLVDDLLALLRNLHASPARLVFPGLLH